MKAIKWAQEHSTHLVIAGDFLDGRSADAHTLYYASLIMKHLSELRGAIVIRGNHDTDNLAGSVSTISHWKHLIPEHVRIVTYPKVEELDDVAYHCIPAAPKYERHLLDAASMLLTDGKKTGAKAHVLVAHGAVKGAKFDNGIESKGGIENKALRKLAESYDFTVFGDFHRHQVLGQSAWYTGSVIQSSLRDEGQAKCFQVIDLRDGNWGVNPYNVGPYFISRTTDNMYKKLPNKEHIHIVVKVGVEEDQDPKTIRYKLLSMGVERVFVDMEASKTDRSSSVISLTSSKNDWIKNYVDMNEDDLPDEKELIVQRGTAYMESVR